MCKKTSPLFIEVTVPSKENEQSCICVLGVSILSPSTFLRFDLGIVPTVWYLCPSFYSMHNNVDISYNKRLLSGNLSLFTTQSLKH
jgi:hypothetical protein